MTTATLTIWYVCANPGDGIPVYQMNFVDPANPDAGFETPPFGAPSGLMPKVNELLRVCGVSPDTKLRIDFVGRKLLLGQMTVSEWFGEAITDVNFRAGYNPPTGKLSREVSP